MCRARTDVLGHSSNPDWQEIFEILVADEADDISFTVKDDNWIGQHRVGACHAMRAALQLFIAHKRQVLLLLTGAPHLGRVSIPIKEVVSGQRTEGWFDLTGPTATKKSGGPMQAQVCLATTLW